MNGVPQLKTSASAKPWWASQTIRNIVVLAAVAAVPRVLGLAGVDTSGVEEPVREAVGAAFDAAVLAYVAIIAARAAKGRAKAEQPVYFVKKPPEEN